MASSDVPKIGRKNGEISPAAPPYAAPVAPNGPSCRAPDVRRLRFGRFVLDLDRGSLRADGSDIALRPKTFEVLCHLALHPDRLIGKEELLQTVWPDIFVTDDSLVQCVAELRRAMADSGQQFIRTVPRRGYRFEAQVAVEPAGAASPPRAGVTAAQRLVRPGSGAQLAAVLCVALIALAGFWLPAGDSPDPAPPLSIVVLPFEPVDSDPDTADLADAVTLDLTTDLARMPGLFVIAHATARTFRDEAVEPRQIGRDLAVRYMLGGSVDRAGDDVRINAELVSASTGEVLWADRLSARRDRLARFRDEIIGRIATTLNFRLTRLESERGLRERPFDPEAIDLTTRGWALVYAGKRPANYAAARRLFREAVDRDPRQVNAHAGIGWTSAVIVLDGWSDEPDADSAAAETAVAEALALDRDHVVAHHVRGFLLRLQRRSGAAWDAFRTVVSLNPNFAPGHAQLAVTALELGRPAEVMQAVERAMRLSPRDPSLGPWLAFVGMAELHRGNVAAAVPWLRRAIDTGTPVARHHAYLASALALAGRQPEAQRALDAFLEASPEATIEGLRAGARSTEPRFLAQQERFFDGLRLAGLAE